MKVKSQLVHVRSDRKDFEKDFNKVYENALKEHVGEGRPEVHFSTCALGSNIFYDAFIVWQVK